MQMNKIQIDRVSASIIVISALLIGVETAFRENNKFEYVFNFLDILVVIYFTFEIFYRIKTVEYSLSIFTETLVSHLPLKKKKERNTSNEALEEWLWISFDLGLIFLSYLSFFRHFFEHPQLLLILRLFRIFRIFRVFELNDSLKRIEKKNNISYSDNHYLFCFNCFDIIYIFDSRHVFI